MLRVFIRVHMPPCAFKTCRKTVGLSAFSLIELLAVIAIVMILSGIAVLGLAGSSLNARKASREIFNAHLNQARAHAIASRKSTALIIPTKDSGRSGLREISMIEVEKKDGSYVPIPDDEEKAVLMRWSKLPNHFHFVTSHMIGMEQPTVVDHEQTVKVFHRGKEIDCHMLVFAPHGQIVYPTPGSPVHVAIAKATHENHTLRISEEADNGKGFDLILVNRLTAKTQIIKP